MHLSSIFFNWEKNTKRREIQMELKFGLRRHLKVDVIHSELELLEFWIETFELWLSNRDSTMMRRLNIRLERNVPNAKSPSSR